MRRGPEREEVAKGHMNRTKHLPSSQAEGPSVSRPQGGSSSGCLLGSWSRTEGNRLLSVPHNPSAMAPPAPPDAWMAQRRRGGCAPSERDDWTHITRCEGQQPCSTATTLTILRPNEMITTGPTKETPPSFYRHLGHWKGALQAFMDRNLHRTFKKETWLTTFCFCFAKRQQWEPYQNM